jgi:predicted RNA-binding protein with PIN domain
LSAGHLIVIDGYNLIHRAPDLKPGPERTLAAARAKLLNLLAWAVGGEARFLVVFDGADDVQGQETGSSRVQLRYARPPLRADDVIRQVVEERVGDVDRLTVVTADLEVARHARAMGATVSLSDLFLASLLGPGRAFEAGEKPSSLSKKEIEEWAEMFRQARDPGDPEDPS